MVMVKIFGNGRFQGIEEEFNEWARMVNPFMLKSIMSTTPVVSEEKKYSLYFTLTVFYTERRVDIPDEYMRRGRM